MTSQVKGKTIGEYFMMKPMIGKGMFGEVFKGYKISNPSQLVAIKVISKEELNKNPKNKENLEYEISVMQRTDLNRDYILQLFSFHQSKHHIYMVLDWMEGGDLAKLIHEQFPRGLPEMYVRKFLYQMASAYRSMRELKILHRDLKPHNILLTNKDLDKAVIKIADFGLARDLDFGLATTQCGSPLYMAPEALHGFKYDERADLWSMGCIVYEMFTGHTPYTAQNIQELMNNIQKYAVVFPKHVFIPPAAQHLISCLLERDPQRRMTCEALWKHPYVQSGAPPKPVQKPSTPVDQIPVVQPEPISLPPPTVTDNKPLDQSFVMVEEKTPQVENAQMMSLEKSVREIPASHVVYSNEVFDFSNKPYDTNDKVNAATIPKAEENARQAWALAECAYLHEIHHQKMQALAVYILAMNFMRKTLEMIKSAYGTNPQPERLKSIALWIRTRFVEFAERSQKLHDALKVLPSAAEVCAEKLLYNYAIELAKNAGYLEFTNTEKKEVQQMYVRAAWVLQYLLTNCEFITTSIDKEALEKCYKLVSSKM